MKRKAVTILFVVLLVVLLVVFYSIYVTVVTSESIKNSNNLKPTKAENIKLSAGFGLLEEEIDEEIEKLFY